MDKTARYVAPRTCRVVDESDPNRVAEKPSKPLGNYADAAAYVLIAEPGAGKTTAFESEAASPGREYETVSGFRTYDDKPEWHDKTLFLDGLDESRAGVPGWPDAAQRHSEEALPSRLPTLSAVLPVG